MPGPIIVAAPDPRWPGWFEEESVPVRAALGRSLLGFEHVGSTSVPGLGGKPTIDMMAGVAAKNEADEALPALAAIGYTDVTPQPEDPDWYYCLGKGSIDARRFHLHLARHGSRFWHRHIVFRDFLRTHPVAAVEYFELKKSLAERYRDERMKYCTAKTGFIRWVEAQAAGVSMTQLAEPDISAVARAFEHWHKTAEQYREYHAQQRRGERIVFVASLAGAVAGYVTLLFVSGYAPFRGEGIPEVADLNVLTEYRRRGIGSALVHAAERLARARGFSALGIGVEQSPAYAPANLLYSRLGFEPDGRGVTASDNELHLRKPLH